MAVYNYNQRVEGASAQLGSGTDENHSLCPKSEGEPTRLQALLEAQAASVSLQPTCSQRLRNLRVAGPLDDRRLSGEPLTHARSPSRSFDGMRRSAETGLDRSSLRLPLAQMRRSADEAFLVRKKRLQTESHTRVEGPSKKTGVRQLLKEHRDQDLQSVRTRAAAAQAQALNKPLDGFRARVYGDIVEDVQRQLLPSEKQALDSLIRRAFKCFKKLPQADQTQTFPKFMMAKVRLPNKVQASSIEKITLLFRQKEIGRGGFGTVESVYSFEKGHLPIPYVVKWIQVESSQVPRSLWESIDLSDEERLICERSRETSENLDDRMERLFDQQMRLCSGEPGIQLPPLGLLRSMGGCHRRGFLMPYYTTDMNRRQIHSFKEFSNHFGRIGEALFRFHQKGACHRDIKPENIFVMEDQDLPCLNRIDICDLDDVHFFENYEQYYRAYRSGTLTLQACEKELWGNFSFLYVNMEDYHLFSEHLKKWENEAEDFAALQKEFIALMRARDVYALATSFIVRLMGGLVLNEPEIAAQLKLLGATDKEARSFTITLVKLRQPSYEKRLAFFDDLNSSGIRLDEPDVADAARSA